MLGQSNQPATFVEFGAEALMVFRDGGFDLLLLDVSMPVMDGVEAVARMRWIEAERGLTHTPAVAVTANAMTHQIEAFLAAVVDGHVAKPIALAALDGAIRAALAAVSATPV